MTKALLFVLFAGAALGDAIPVTVSGEFWLDNFMDGNALMSLYGSNGTDSVFFGGDIPVGVAPPASFSASSLYLPWLQGYAATIDGVTSDLWSLLIDDGTGFVEIFDTEGNVLASVDITSAPIQITSLQEYGTRFLDNGNLNDDWEASGTFSSDPVSGNDPPLSDVPEAGSGLLAGVGIGAALLLRGILGR